MRAVVLNWWRFCSIWDIWPRLETFLTVTNRKGAYSWEEARDAAKHPTMHRIAHNNELPAHSIKGNSNKEE